MKHLTNGELIAILQKRPADLPVVLFDDGKGVYYPVHKKNIKFVMDPYFPDSRIPEASKALQIGVI